MFRLRAEINGVRQPFVQEPGHLFPDADREIDLRVEHGTSAAKLSPG
jgi:hypothetical protein